MIGDTEQVTPKDHGVDKETGASLWRQEEKFGAAQPGEEKVLWRPHNSLSESEGAKGKPETNSVRNCRQNKEVQTEIATHP